MRSKKAIINIISLIALQAVTLICGFIVPKLIITNYGSNVNGLISSIGKFLAYVSLMEVGFGNVVKAILYKPLGKNDNKTIAKILKAADKFYKKIAIVFLIYVIVLAVCFSKLIFKEFEYLYTASLIIILSLSIFAEYFFGLSYRMFLQAKQKAYVTSFINLITLIINTIVVVILIKFGATIHIVKLATAIIFITRPFIQNFYVKKKYNLDVKNIKTDFVIKQKWEGLPQHIAYVVRINTDIILITFFLSMAEVSVYYVYSIIVTSLASMVENIAAGTEAAFGDIIAKKEKEILNKRFDIFEFIFYTIVTILFVCAMLLIVPFVSVYTKGITDVNYIRYTFGYLIVISEFAYATRIPYMTIVLAAGHLKQMKIPAFIEAGLNIVISLCLISKLGIIGVLIGTIVGMIFRTLHLMYYTSKNILDRNMIKTFKYLIIAALEFLLIVLGYKYIHIIDVNSYLEWIIEAIKVFLITAITVLVINCGTNIKQTKETIKCIGNYLKGAKK